MPYPDACRFPREIGHEPTNGAIISGPGKEIAECLFGGPEALRPWIWQAEQMLAAARKQYDTAPDRLLPLTGDRYCDMFRGPDAVERERAAAQASIERIQKFIDRTRANLAAREVSARAAA